MDISNLDNYCPACASAKVGLKLSTLEADLESETSYSGELLTESEINAVNNMCGVANKLELGSIINGVLSASKNGTKAEELSDENAEIINKGMCGLFSDTAVGTKLQEMIEKINAEEPASDEAKITAYSILGVSGTIDEENHTIALEVPYETDVTALVATFTLSEGASAKVGETAQISGTTENDFTNAVTYVVTAEDEVTTQSYEVTVTVAPQA